MKLSQIADQKIDLSEIESDYLWGLKDTLMSPTIYRICLSTLEIDFTQKLSCLLLKIILTIPHNKIYGIFAKSSDGEHSQFILDENLNFKKIDTWSCSYFRGWLVSSCFYDDSIFTFEDKRGFEFIDRNRLLSPCARRYLISQNRWILLSRYPFGHEIDSCAGINQKIVIALRKAELWVYDIILDSYSKLFPIGIQRTSARKSIFKAKGNMYLMIYSQATYIYSCYDPFLEWHFICEFYKPIPWTDFSDRFSSIALYKANIYYLNNLTIFKFDLREFESKWVKWFIRVKKCHKGFKKMKINFTNLK